MLFSLNRHYSYYALFWPFRWPLFFAISGAWGINYFIRAEQLVPSYSGEVLMLAGKILFVFLLCIPLLVGLMLLLTYLMFKFKKTKPNVSWNNNRLEVTHLIQPFLGFVRIHLLKQDNVYSESILLLPSNQSGIFFFTGTMVSSPLTLSEIIRTEVIDGLVIHFEDPFRFFSFSLRCAVNIERTRLPDAEAERSNWMTLKHPDREEQHTQSQQPRPGDWFHLKSFEPGDDVRRIVWNLYARHKELMVRQQDKQQPYGDTLRVFVSFHVLSAIQLDSTLMLFFETYYKQRIYALMGGLLQEGLLIDWRSEGTAWIKGVSSETLAIALSKSAMHCNSVSTELTESESPSIVFISSIDDLDVVTNYTRQWPNAIFIDVDLQRAIAPPSWPMRVSRLWLKPPNANQHQIQLTWWRHPLKGQLNQHSELLKSVLLQNTKEGGVHV